MQMQITAKFTPLQPTATRQIEKAAAVAVTRTAWDVRDGLVDTMRDRFDRPTPFTLRAWRVEMARASAGSLEAVVYAAPRQSEYLLHQIEGGQRGSKGFERKMRMFGGAVALPGMGAKLNQYGNMPISFIKAVGSDTNTSGKAGRFFAGKPKGQPGAAAGVWARVDNNKRLVSMMVFADSATYKSRLDVSAIAGRVVSARFESQLMRAMAAIK